MNHNNNDLTFFHPPRLLLHTDRYEWENYHFIEFSEFKLSDSPPTFDQKKIIDMTRLAKLKMSSYKLVQQTRAMKKDDKVMESSSSTTCS